MAMLAPEVLFFVQVVQDNSEDSDPAASGVLRALRARRLVRLVRVARLMRFRKVMTLVKKFNFYKNLRSRKPPQKNKKVSGVEGWGRNWSCDLWFVFLNIIRKWPHLVRLLLGSHTIDEQRLLLWFYCHSHHTLQTLFVFQCFGPSQKFLVTKKTSTSSGLLLCRNPSWFQRGVPPGCSFRDGSHLLSFPSGCWS